MKVTRRKGNATPIPARMCSTNTARQYSAYARETPVGPLSPATSNVTGSPDSSIVRLTAVLMSGK